MKHVSAYEIQECHQIVDCREQENNPVVPAAAELLRSIVDWMSPGD